MDVNGTRFHLVAGQEDWERFDVAPEKWAEWDDTTGATVLAPLPFEFTPPTEAPTLVFYRRRGTAADRFGTIYWIGADFRSIYRLHKGSRKAELFWRTESLIVPTQPCSGEFTDSPCSPEPTSATPAEARFTLVGLTVTDHHHLVVGLRVRPKRGELLVFDLYAGGAPVRMAWPHPNDVAFLPWDLDPAPNGGVWVLDRANRRIWLVDRSFRVVVLESGTRTITLTTPSDFGPMRGGKPIDPDPEPIDFPRPLQLSAKRPISIAGLPDGSVLILDRPDHTGPSIIWHHRATGEEVKYVLDDLAKTGPKLSITGYDLAYVPDDERPRERGVAYVVERKGNQAYAFSVDWTKGEPFTHVDTVHLPMQRYGAAELVVRDGYALYDVGERWIELRWVKRPKYQERATITTREPFDSGILDCVWHRIVIDACIPAGATVDVDVRAANDRRDLATAHWLRQPRPYRRGDGTELPYYTPVNAGGDSIDSWETLLQDVRGRWMQLRLVIHATGRVTPHLHALRLHYPRFSYLDRYFPRVYRDEPVSASFTERLLADFEGMYTTWEGRIADVRRYFDAQAVPEEALEWLMGWLNVAAQPLWKAPRKRLFLEHLMDLYWWHGTAHGLTMALRLHLEENPDASIFDPPAARSGRATFEDRRRERVRLVERFRTRRSGGAQEGLDTGASGGGPLAPLTRELVVGAAHRFVVLVPDGLDRQQLDAVRRIVDLQKPAHSCYTLQTLWELFRVGTARLEIDTDLGDGRCFTPLVLGAGFVGAGSSLGARHPFDIRERVILDRDRVGIAPAL